LKQRLSHGRLDPPDAIGILAQVASALDAAHARGLVHRDVKPSNVLLDRGARPDGSDHVYLADFGLTRRASDDVVDDGRVMGTLDYVAPEVIAGEEVDGRADVYSLGCVRRVRGARPGRGEWPCGPRYPWYARFEGVLTTP
jgi:serine/threonine protein kinase